MVPKLTIGGRNFDGAAAYYLADKAPPGQARALTAHRVAWTATRNLATTDPHEACRIMVATADCQLALKAAAGVKATGRKLEKPVLAYSLAWHPSERPTQAEQLAAAEESLAALGLSGHQAVIVAHNDEPQAHVHCLVNRVDPATGRAARLSRSKLVLSQWAEAYERRQGRILCVERVENNARRAGTRPGRAAANRSPRVSRVAYRAGGGDRPEAAALRAHHAELFSVERGRARQNRDARRAEAAAFYAGRKASRRATTVQLTARKVTGAEAETQARLATLLASEQPADALAGLTRDRSTFTRRELERFVARHTADAAGFAAALAALDRSGRVIFVGRDDSGRDRFTTAEHQAIERRLFAHAAGLHRPRPGVRPTPARFAGQALSGDQDAALRHVLAAPRIAAVTGVSGAGKSTMLNAARQSWEADRLRVRGLALAAEAAESLRQSAGIKRGGTIHKQLFLWEQGRDLPGPNDVIVVDEAGMVGSRLTERLLHFAAAGGAKIVLVGDARQLQAIEAGGAFRAIVERIGAAAITTVRRQQAAWQRAATTELAAGQVEAALARYEAAGMVHAHDTDAAAKTALIDAWHRHRLTYPDQTQLVMAFRRRDVAALNALARACLRADSALGEDVDLDTAAGRQAFAVGDRVYFTRNDARLGVRNGSLGTIEVIDGRALTVRLDGAPPLCLTFSLDAYGHIAHGYAATIHKSQGATVDRAHLYCSPNLDQHAAYVAMTRHRQRLDLHWSNESIPSRARLTAILSRLALKDTSFDYATAAAEARHEAADDMQARLGARAKVFAAREATPAGRMANARALLPANATSRQLAQLALDAVGRARLFRQRQGRLRTWARGIVPAAHVAVAARRPAAATLGAARLQHASATFAQLQAMEARHAAERLQERLARRALQRQAALNWRAEASAAKAAPGVICTGRFGAAFWQAAVRPTPTRGPGRPAASTRPR